MILPINIQTPIKVCKRSIPTIPIGMYRIAEINITLLNIYVNTEKLHITLIFSVFPKPLKPKNVTGKYFPLFA